MFFLNIIAITTRIIVAIFSIALSQTNKALHSQGKGRTNVFNSAFGMLVNREIPSDNCGITNPLVAASISRLAENSFCFKAIWLIKSKSTKIKGAIAIVKIKSIKEMIYPIRGFFNAK